MCEYTISKSIVVIPRPPCSSGWTIQSPSAPRDRVADGVPDGRVVVGRLRERLPAQRRRVLLARDRRLEVRQRLPVVEFLLEHTVDEPVHLVELVEVPGGELVLADEAEHELRGVEHPVEVRAVVEVLVLPEVLDDGQRVGHLLEGAVRGVVGLAGVVVGGDVADRRILPVRVEHLGVAPLVERRRRDLAGRPDLAELPVAAVLRVLRDPPVGVRETDDEDHVVEQVLDLRLLAPQDLLDEPRASFGACPL
jgi:hypothetical protein